MIGKGFRISFGISLKSGMREKNLSGNEGYHLLLRDFQMISCKNITTKQDYRLSAVDDCMLMLLVRLDRWLFALV